MSSLLIESFVVCAITYLALLLAELFNPPGLQYKPPFRNSILNGSDLKVRTNNIDLLMFPMTQMINDII